MNYILTHNPNSLSLLLEELEPHPISLVKILSDEAILVKTSLEISAFHDLIQTQPIVFLRHLFQVHQTFPFSETSAFPDLVINQQQTFSIQLRSPSELRKNANRYRLKWADHLTASGYTLDVKNPQQIISVFISDDTAYVGVDTPDHLLSNWSGGAMHFSLHDYFVSRAEFKLREIFHLYPHFQGNKAIDLGAAPGGWSYVLAQNGFNVDAIDPANLDKRVKQMKQIRHYPITARTYLQEIANEPVDLIVNDMKMSAFESIAMMKDSIPTLKDEGLMVLTVKMPKEFTLYQVQECIDLLRKSFVIRFARQLFHNRHEFTLILAKK